MSYVVSIRRALPIMPDELQAAIDGEPDFSFAERIDEEDGSSLTLRWADESTSTPEYFVLERGTIGITTPSDRALRAAQILARKLQAEVVGEEGESLTEVEVPDTDAPGCGPLAWTVLLIAGILAAYWFFD